MQPSLLLPQLLLPLPALLLAPLLLPLPAPLLQLLLLPLPPLLLPLPLLPLPLLYWGDVQGRGRPWGAVRPSVLREMLPGAWQQAQRRPARLLPVPSCWAQRRAWGGHQARQALEAEEGPCAQVVVVVQVPAYR